MKRFKYAFEGIRVLFVKDFHFAGHLIIAFSVMIFGFVFGLGTIEWLFILNAIFIVLITEIINTSLEYTVDLVTDEYHALAKYAKDTSALAVLLAAFYAVITGLIIFLPKLIELFT